MMTKTKTNTHEELKTAAMRLFGSNGFILGFLIGSMLFICVLGPWVYLIAVGLLWGMWTISMTFDVPYQLIIRIFRLENMPEHLPKPDLSIILYKLVNLIVPGSLVYMGIKALVFFDFDLHSTLFIFIR